MTSQTPSLATIMYLLIILNSVFLIVGSTVTPLINYYYTLVLKQKSPKALVMAFIKNNIQVLLRLCFT